VEHETFQANSLNTTYTTILIRVNILGSRAASLTWNDPKRANDSAPVSHVSPVAALIAENVRFTRGLIDPRGSLPLNREQAAKKAAA
jgi:hypothetical protein